MFLNTIRVNKEQFVSVRDIRLFLLQESNIYRKLSNDPNRDDDFRTCCENKAEVLEDVEKYINDIKT